MSFVKVANPAGGLLGLCRAQVQIRHTLLV